MMGARIRVVWVEDDAAFVRQMCATCKLSDHFDIVTATSKSEALVALESKPDRALVDLCLGEYGNDDGLFVCETARSKGIATLGFSGELTMRTQLYLRSIGVDALVKKGSVYNPALFVEMITLGRLPANVERPTLVRTTPEERTLDSVRVLAAFRRNGECITRAAKELGCSRQALQWRLYYSKHPLLEDRRTKK